MKRILLMTGLFAIVFCMCCGFADALSSKKKTLVRVGTYDSRAMPVAYSSSDLNDKYLQKIAAEHKQAQADGDTEKAKQLSEKMNSLQSLRHKQAFSTAPVDDLLKVIEKKIPQIAKEKGVDIIVSKWDINYMGKDVDTVDVTMELAIAFEPDEKALKSIEAMMKIKPMTIEELEKALKDHPH